MHSPNKTTRYTLTATIIATLLSLPVSAEDGRPEKGRKGPEGRAAKAMLERFDTDGNGKLSDAEKAKARAAAEARRQTSDTNGDGKVSPEERLAAFKKHLEENEALAAKVLERFDADASGDLSDEELAKAGQRMRKARGGKNKRDGRGPRRGKRGGGDS